MCSTLKEKKLKYSHVGVGLVNLRRLALKHKHENASACLTSLEIRFQDV